jgi:hypothetical protein
LSHWVEVRRMMVFLTQWIKVLKVSTGDYLLFLNSGS